MEHHLPFRGLLSVLGLPNKYHRLGGRSNRNAFSHMPEAKSQTWGVGRAELPPSEGSREWSFCFSQLLVAPGSPWLVAASLQSLPQLPLAACLHRALFRLGVPLLSSVRTPATLRIKGHLVLTYYICKDPISKQGPVVRHWGLGHQHSSQPDTVQPITRALGGKPEPLGARRRKQAGGGEKSSQTAGAGTWRAGGL